ncbi:MAG TPA: ABC transporter ATP-binding protein [Candidatus Dormibacteraeota bacterium]|nr:ABC transporter ATP-binding protein [Candidatus Dormibacteraeota bacterium]
MKRTILHPLAVSPMTAPPLLTLHGITKRFPGVVANDRVSFEVRAGEIHAVVGENGAGKTTLMNILYGLYQPDDGQILWRGAPAQLTTPRAALELGIGMVHQHFMLIPRFTVAENIILGAEPARGTVIDFGQARDRVWRLTTQYGFGLEPDLRVQALSVGAQQQVEILKVLYRGAELLILDEPTAVLVPQEVTDLFANLRRLREQGRTIIFISHKLDEVLEIADRITVLRRGQVVGTLQAAAASKAALAEMMVGRPVLMQLRRREVAPGPACLEVQHLSVLGPTGRLRVRDMSFGVRSGEIYAIAGVEGNGQSELVEAIVGLRPAQAGRILLVGGDITALDVERRRAIGLAYIPEDRHLQGLVLPMSVAENLILGHLDQDAFLDGPFLDERAVAAFAAERVRDYDVRVPSISTPALALSGGNQQKVVIAREFAFAPTALIAAQPTRGLDIGASEFVYEKLLRAKADGLAVLLVSADLDELFTLADRIGVVFNGELVAEFGRGEVDATELGVCMTGGKRPPSGATP